ncbi:hypothetical protein [Pseudonocardia sp. GCM10023141]|uniref:hypothetical protein n=1 Tax=Pseudonocardia sp. GCM10023141 TaxID=3252653 RepID=UPI0036085C0D
MTTPRSGFTRWLVNGGWYLPVVVASLGLLSFVPFLDAAYRTRRPIRWVWAGVYGAADVALVVLAGNQVPLGVFAVLPLFVGAVHSVVLHRSLYAGSLGPVPRHPKPAPDPAVAAVLAARTRREDARALAAADPRMARELHIGRPDLSRTYDDGGLVDLNSAPAEVIAQACDIDLDAATLIAETRAAGLTFATVDDVFAFADIPFELWDRIRDRGVVIAP